MFLFQEALEQWQMKPTAWSTEKITQIATLVLRGMQPPWNRKLPPCTQACLLIVRRNSFSKGFKLKRKLRINWKRPLKTTCKYDGYIKNGSQSILQCSSPHHRNKAQLVGPVISEKTGIQTQRKAMGKQMKQPGNFQRRYEDIIRNQAGTSRSQHHRLHQDDLCHAKMDYSTTDWRHGLPMPEIIQEAEDNGQVNPTWWKPPPYFEKTNPTWWIPDQSPSEEFDFRGYWYDNAYVAPNATSNTYKNITHASRL